MVKQTPTAIIYPPKVTDVGGTMAVKKQIQSALSKKGINNISVRVKKDKREVHIYGDITEADLRSLASHSDLIRDVDYKGYASKEDNQDNGERQRLPSDYGLLKGKLNQREQELQESNRKVLSLENKLNQQTKALKDLEAKSNIAPSVHDFISEMMIRENRLWKNFTEAYYETLHLVSQLYDLDQSTLEQESTRYKKDSLERNKEFKKLKSKWKKAQAAEEAAKDNPYLEIKTEAKEISQNMKRMIERDRSVSETRAELMAHTKDTKMRIAVSSREGKTFVTLPFEYKGKELGEYNSLERGVVGAINKSLSNSKAVYEQGNFEGLLRYKIADLKTRAKNRLVKTVYSCEDAFTNFGGKREVIRVDIL